MFSDIWVWPVLPLQGNENQLVSENEVRPGNTLDLVVGEEPAFMLFPFDKVLLWREFKAQFYRPLEREIQVIATAYPEIEDPCNPPWSIIEADLLTSEVAVNHVREHRASTLIKFLKRHLKAEEKRKSLLSKELPDKIGYVERPTDQVAYRPFSEVFTKYIPEDMQLSERQLVQIIEDYSTNKVRWTRPLTMITGKPNGRRREIHLVDWLEYVEKTHPQSDEATPQEIVVRKAKIREMQSQK